MPVHIWPMAKIEILLIREPWECSVICHARSADFYLGHTLPPPTNRHSSARRTVAAYGPTSHAQHVLLQT